MKLVDKYMALSPDFVLQCLAQSYSEKEFYRSLGVGAKLRYGRGREEFELKYNLDVKETIKQNILRKAISDKNALFSQDRICKRPECNNCFSWNERPYSEFCSSFCAHSYSGSHANSKNISAGMKASEKVKTACIR